MNIKTILKICDRQDRVDLNTLKRKFSKNKNDKIVLPMLIKKAEKLGYISFSKTSIKITTRGKEYLFSDNDAYTKKEGYKGNIRSANKEGYKGKPKSANRVVLNIDVKNPKLDAKIIAEALKIPIIFNSKCRNEARDYPNDIEDLELEDDRVDLRELYTVTIDGADSKDFDDAISIEKVGHNYKIGVHIADVSHFVPPTSSLDKEAKKRGNSVYLIDTVYPMFPEELSNGLCSLNENVVRFTMTAFMTIDSSGEVLHEEFCKSAIKSSRRLTYDYVQDVLDGVEDDEPHLKDLIKMSNECKEILFKKRINSGSIDFNFKEVLISLDKRGKPTHFSYYERKESHRIIEELMLLANCSVARKIAYIDGAIYRTHGNPDPDKLIIFMNIAHNRGYHVIKDEDGNVDFNKFIDAVRGKKDEKLLLTLLLKSMKQATYDTKNIGHFGLGFSHYTHFTSPIRRYTDLLTHRILKKDLANNGKYKLPQNIKKMYSNVAIWCSTTERVAIDAERKLHKVKATRFMEDKVGLEYDGIISGITQFGFFVEISKFGIEGLVRYADLNERYAYNEKEELASSYQSDKKYCLADEIKVSVLRVNVGSLYIDLVPL